FTDRQILHYPHGHHFFRKGQALDVIPRFEFDNALWQATVKAGAETLENARVTGLLKGERGVCGVQLQDSNGTRELSCGLVVGADGSRSIVRQATGSTDDEYVIHAPRQCGGRIAFAIDSAAMPAEVLTDDRIPEARKGAVYERRVLRRVRPTFLSPLA